MTSGRDWGGRLPGYPPAMIRRYRDTGLWGDRTIAEEFHAVAERFPTLEAVVSSEGRMIYEELDRRTDQIGAGLHGLGLLPGDPVLFQLSNRLHSILAWYSCLKAGLVPVATLAAHRRHEISQIASRVGAVAHLVETDYRATDLVALALDHRKGHPTMRRILTVGNARPVGDTTPMLDLGAGTGAAAARSLVASRQDGLDPDDVAVFQLSGGTTGVPKVIPRRHAEYWYNARAYAGRLGWDERCRVAHLIPIIHNAGVVCGVHGPHSAGACLVLGTPDAAASMPLLIDEKITDVLVGHAHFHAIDRKIEALAGTVRRVVLSGTKVPPDLFEKIERLGVWPGQLFGMAEGLLALSELEAPRQGRLTTVGTPLSGLDEFRILEPGMERALPDGVTGELSCRGPYTIPGYFDAPEHNAVAFTSDGFYRTGDLASVVSIDGQRCLSIDGRIKDVINRGGEKINAEELELLLVRHPGIRESSVVGMPDARLGERTCAFLVAAGPHLTLAEVRDHLDGLGVAKFKWPERLEWLDELPRSNIGKIDKEALRRMASGTVDRASSAAT